MIDWLFGTVLGKCVMTFLISLLPVVELRGGIPLWHLAGTGSLAGLRRKRTGQYAARPVPAAVRAEDPALDEALSPSRPSCRFAGAPRRPQEQPCAQIRAGRSVHPVAIPLPGTGAWTGAPSPR